MISQNKTFNGEELRLYVEEMLVPHTAFKEANKALEQAYLAAHTIKDPIGFYISGESRTGKSRLIEEFMDAHPSSREIYGLKHPVVKVLVPSKPTVKGLASEILRALEDPMADKGTEQEKTARLLVLLKQCEVRVLILDEVQHLVDKSAKFEVIHHVSDWLKNLINQSKVVAVIAGLPYARKIFNQNEQLRGRFTNKISIPRFDWQDKTLRIEFLGLLAGFNALMAERFDLPDLSSNEIGIRFYLASGGLTGYVFNILRKTVWDVIDDQRTDITLEDFDVGYRSMVSEEDQQEVSPFSRDFDINDGQAFEKAKEVGLRAEDYIPKKMFTGSKKRIH